MNPNIIALGTVAVLAIAFLINKSRLSSQRKRQPIAIHKKAQEEEPKLWLAGDYFVFVNSLVRASKTWAQLDNAMVHVENYKDKQFREPIPKADLDAYHDRLLDSYDSKVIEFEKHIPVVVYKN